jgi:hypothetical protein
MICPNCELALTAAPWRYDDAEHGIHWVCPSDERVDSEVVYAPISLSQAIAEYLSDNYEADSAGGRIGARLRNELDDASARHPARRAQPLPIIG